MSAIHGVIADDYYRRHGWPGDKTAKQFRAENEIHFSAKIVRPESGEDPPYDVELLDLDHNRRGDVQETSDGRLQPSDPALSVSMFDLKEYADGLGTQVLTEKQLDGLTVGSVTMGHKLALWGLLGSALGGWWAAEERGPQTSLRDLVAKLAPEAVKHGAQAAIDVKNEEFLIFTPKA